jgi:hypothetical protein
MQSPKDDADRLLAIIAADVARLKRTQHKAQDAMDRAFSPYEEEINSLMQIIATNEKALEALVVKQEIAILDGKDRADLLHGSVMLKLEKRVKRIRGMLDQLKSSGLTDAVKTVESVDWDRVEKLDDATLERLGTHRIEKPHFAYELKGVEKS